jgi:hypothetical protein
MIKTEFVEIKKRRKKMKTKKTSAYYQKRANEEWQKMFEYAEEAERWFTCIGCPEEFEHNTQRARQAARRATLYEIMAKNLKPLSPTGFSARRVKLQFDANPLPFNFDVDDDCIPLTDD